MPQHHMARRGAQTPRRSRVSGIVACLLASTVLALALVGEACAQDESIGAAGATPCTVSIKSCGCTITAPGFYDVAANLANTRLNTDASCIAIKSPNVVLWLDNMSIVGNTAGTGIHVLASASNSAIEGTRVALPMPSPSPTPAATISGWGTGILIEGSGTVVDNLTTENNASAGVEVSKSTSVVISGLTSTGNLYGVWLNNTSFDEVAYSPAINSNTGDGILIGCTGSGCPKKAASNHNRIVGNTLNKNKSGIVIVSGSGRNVVTNNSVTTISPGDDLMDQNNQCGTDIWFGNMFTVAEPIPCIN